MRIGVRESGLKGRGENIGSARAVGKELATQEAFSRHAVPDSRCNVGVGPR